MGTGARTHNRHNLPHLRRFAPFNRAGWNTTYDALCDFAQTDCKCVYMTAKVSASGKTEPDRYDFDLYLQGSVCEAFTSFARPGNSSQGCNTRRLARQLLLEKV